MLDVYKSCDLQRADIAEQASLLRDVLLLGLGFGSSLGLQVKDNPRSHESKTRSPEALKRETLLHSYLGFRGLGFKGSGVLGLGALGLGLKCPKP